MKRIILIILSLLLFCLTLVSLSIPSVAYESADGLWSYSLNSGKANITAYHGSASKVVIPATIDGYNVELGGTVFSPIDIQAKNIIVSEGITKVAFGRNIYIETVKLPSTVIEIGNYAFYDTPLKEINFPDNLKTIGKGAFLRSDYPGSVALPDSLTVIGEEAFRESGIKEIYVPGSVDEVPSYCCYCCDALEKVVIAEGVKKIGGFTFVGCSSLTEVYIPKSVIDINQYAFQYNSSTNVVIYGYKDSVAESFAEDNNIKFVAIKPVTGVSLSPAEITLASGNTAQLTCTISPSDATNKNVTWKSSKPSVATVNSTGLVTSVSEGTAVITAKSEDGGFEATCTVTVHDHSYTASVERAATCSLEGIMRYTCSCGDTYTKPINKTAHKYTSKVTTEPGCTTPGVKTFTCSGCQTYYTESINPTGHSITSSVTKSPTCTEKGTRHYFCTKCEYNYDETIPASGHNMTSSVTKAATCTEDGTLHNYCTRCTYSYDSVIQAEGHHFGNWTTVSPATKTREGKEERSCSVCHETETRSIPAEGKLSSATITIKNNPGKRTLNYRESIVLTAEVSGQASGDKVVWYVNDKKYGEGNTFEYGELKANITVKAVLVDKNGNEYFNTEEKDLADEEKIEVKSDFFTKLIAFFKGIFGGNPVIKQ
ncbi:MAG: leucine-rich repeat protein [Clostridia bacterium]|nr:leucine-rich repeat protein [Clostridia bacterium]